MFYNITINEISLFELLITLHYILIYFVELETPPDTQDFDFGESPPPAARFKREIKEASGIIL